MKKIKDFIKEKWEKISNKTKWVSLGILIMILFSIIAMEFIQIQVLVYKLNKIEQQRNNCQRELVIEREKDKK